jgi:hypothetical protein
VLIELFFIIGGLNPTHCRIPEINGDLRVIAFDSFCKIVLSLQIVEEGKVLLLSDAQWSTIDA